jgi:Fe2+ transport system protein FeoA
MRSFLMRLLPDQLVDGAHATVRAVRANAPDQDARMRRLREIGFIAGEPL